MSNSEILVRRKNSIVLPTDPGVTNSGVIAAFNLNLQELGYTLSAQAIKKFKSTAYTASVAAMTRIIEFAKKARGADVTMNPMYPNFPAQVAEASSGELYLNAVLHYFSVWLADSTYDENFVWLPTYRKNTRGVMGLSAGDKVKLTVLNVITGSKAGFIYQEILKQIVTSNTSVSDQDKQDIRKLVYAGYVVGLDAEIPNKENLAVYAAALIQERAGLILDKWFQHGTDVLRLATALSGGDVSLKENTKFVSFPRYQRRLLSYLLSKDPNIQEAFARDRERFIRLGERLHPGALKGYEYRDLRNAFKILRSGARLETFNGEVESLLLQKHARKAAKLLSTRPGEFARRLDHLLLLTQNQMPAQLQIVNQFDEVASKVSTPVLLQLMTHFKNRNTQNVRVIMPKGEASKVQLLDEGPRRPINPRAIGDITESIAAVLISRFSELSDLGKVYVDPELKNYLVPFSQRSASSGLRTIVRGSQVPFGDTKDTLRFFIHWKNTGKKSLYDDYRSGIGGRVDLDLSANMYDSDWNDKGRVYYGNLRDYNYGYGSRPNYKAVHSGDITDAPNGAAEFIDIDIPSTLAYGGRYIVVTVNMFAGPEKISEVPECFAGWMLRDKPQSGEVFEPKTVIDKLDITSESRMVVPMIIDVQERRMIWVDSEIFGAPRWGGNVMNQQDKIVIVGKAFTQIKKTNLYDLLMLHAVARGTVVKTEASAETVFSVKNGIQFDLAKISSEFLG